MREMRAKTKVVARGTRIIRPGAADSPHTTAID
jgi:hypothetical protein